MDIIIVTINNITSSCIMKNNLFKNLDNIIIFKLGKLKILSNCIYVFIKHLPGFNVLTKLKNNNNYLVYEPLDINWSVPSMYMYLNNIKDRFKYFDYILCNNKSILDIYKKNLSNKTYYLNYHEYDNFHVKFNYEYDNFKIPKIFYIGALQKSSFKESFIKNKKIIYIKSSNYNDINEINFNGIHIDFLLEHKIYYSIHTSTKLATCLKCNSIFICNKIPIYVELLGEEYEYYLDDDLNNFDLIVNKAINTYMDIKQYNNYLYQVKNIKEKLSPEYCLKNYIELFNIINDNKNKE
jgi:hypothetical protein